ncbi:hypothetical protein L1987_13245 [Smallanthus sonchifolius]|uniref:Uncharacterized protein n=1 Tax=Smallanthus sonchifolius TaxID=185202 RepID=A0ACB9JGX0_9ASTR|nr:hypothetical protein L1987_13245 [Smallanthus sonchifolius]
MSKQTGPSYNTRGKKKQAVNENAVEIPNSYKELQKLIVEGIKDSLPIIFTEMEKRQADKLSVQLKCTEEDKVLCASNLFKDQVLEWWNNRVAAKGRDPAYAMGWGAFKTRIEKKYVPQNEREQIEGKFLSLNMIGTNHQEYSTKLLEYARIVPHLAIPDSNLIKRYIWGLIGEIRDMVKVANCENLDDVMDLGASLLSSLIRNQE